MPLKQRNQNNLLTTTITTTNTTNTIIIITTTTTNNNDTQKLLWDFNIRTDHLIPARRPDLIITTKKSICKIVDFAVPADHRINLNESEKKDKYLDLARELKKLWNMKVTIVPIVIGALGTISTGLLKRPGGLGSWWTCSDYPNDSIDENSQNPETCPGDLRRLAVTQLQ